MHRQLSVALAAATVVPALIAVAGVSSAQPASAQSASAQSASAQSASAQSPAGPAEVEVRADFNGDRIADLAIGAPYEDQGARDAGTVHVIYGTGTGLSEVGDQLWSQDSAGILGSGGILDGFGNALATGDFDDDGFTDLAIAVPWEDTGDTNAGAVNVLYGAAGGLSSAGNQMWTQDSVNIAGDSEFGDVFGGDLAAGDFDSDGYADLAIGVPWEDETVADDGAVNVIYGSASGLHWLGNQVWSQDSVGVGGTNEPGDNFGLNLAAADFGNTAHADLAIGVPYENGAGADDGSVQVLYGTGGGLSAGGNQVWTQDSAGIGGGSEAGDRFGSSLAAANLGNSFHADLAIGVPYEDQANVDDGAVNVIYGSAGGLSSVGNQVWSQDSGGIGGGCDPGDRFGFSLAAANFGNSTQADLAIGVPYEFQSFAEDGAVNVIYGAAGGLNAAGNQVWSQDSAGIFGVREAGDRFGWSLTAANLGRTVQADLVIGVPFEDQPTENDGSINVIYGATAGLNQAGNQVWDQNSVGILGDQEEDDNFGSSLAAG